jgi:hypothetical protein
VGTRPRLHHHGPALLERLQADRRPGLAPPQAVTAQVRRDLVQPGREAGFSLEAFDRLVSFEEGLLADVARFFFGPEEAVGGVLDPVFLLRDQDVEGGRLPGLARLDQLLVAPAHAACCPF